MYLDIKFEHPVVTYRLEKAVQFNRATSIGAYIWCLNNFFYKNEI